MGFRMGLSEFWEQDLAFIMDGRIFGLGFGVCCIFWGLFDAVEDFVVEDFGTLVHWVLGGACLYLLDGTILH